MAANLKQMLMSTGIGQNPAEKVAASLVPLTDEVMINAVYDGRCPPPSALPCRRAVALASTAQQVHRAPASRREMRLRFWWVAPGT